VGRDKDVLAGWSLNVLNKNERTGAGGGGEGKAKKVHEERLVPLHYVEIKAYQRRDRSGKKGMSERYVGQEGETDVCAKPRGAFLRLTGSAATVSRWRNGGKDMPACHASKRGVYNREEIKEGDAMKGLPLRTKCIDEPR